MTKILNLLKQSKWYCFLKYSKLGKSILRQKYPHIIQAQQKEEQLFKQVLPQERNSLIFDIGGSIGSNTVIFLKMNARVVVLEPEPNNFKCLKSRFGRNKNVTLIQKAVSNNIGIAELFVQENGSSLHTLSTYWKTYLTSKQNNRWQKKITFSTTIKTETTTLDQLITDFGQPDFIKIDVEGFEDEVIQGLTQPVGQLCFEANLPQFTEQTIHCIQSLGNIHKNISFNYSIKENLELDQYVSQNEIIDIVSNSQMRYMDIFCKMD